MAEDFGKKIERFGQDVWKKTTDAVSVIGKNSELANKKRELKAVYSEIGQQFCSRHASQAAEEFSELTAHAKELAAEIADLEAQILEQRGSKKCVSCGESIPFAAAYCSSCGAVQPKPTPDEEPAVEAEVVDGWTCPVCSAKMGSSDSFCSVCGAKRP